MEVFQLGLELALVEVYLGLLVVISAVGSILLLNKSKSLVLNFNFKILDSLAFWGALALFRFDVVLKGRFQLINIFLLHGLLLYSLMALRFQLVL